MQLTSWKGVVYRDPRYQSLAKGKDGEDDVDENQKVYGRKIIHPEH